MCTPRIDEYAGVKIIKKNGTNPGFDTLYSEVVYDPATKRVGGITFVMNRDAYWQVMELLKVKYGEVETNRDTRVVYWHYDKGSRSYISLMRNEATECCLRGQAKPAHTEVNIKTSAMLISEAAAEEGRRRENREKNAKALKGL